MVHVHSCSVWKKRNSCCNRNTQFEKHSSRSKTTRCETLYLHALLQYFLNSSCSIIICSHCYVIFKSATTNLLQMIELITHNVCKKYRLFSLVDLSDTACMQKREVESLGFSSNQFRRKFFNNKVNLTEFLRKNRGS